MTIKSEILVKRTSSTMGAQDLLPTKIARLNDHPSFQGLPEELQNSIFQMANDPGLSVVSSSFQRLNLVALESSWKAFESAICGLSENQTHPLFIHYVAMRTLNPNGNWLENAKTLIQRMSERLKILDPEAFRAKEPQKRTFDLEFCVAAANRLKEINDLSLQHCWEEIHLQVSHLGQPINNLPQLGASAEQIRDWLNNPQSQGAILSIHVLIFSNLSLSVIPPELARFTNLRRLDLSNNMIKGIMPGTFDSFQLLRRLDLSINQISFIPDNLFFNCTDLTHVSFENNQLDKIPKFLFITCPSLKTLNFSLNEINKIPELLFRGSTKIEKVNFSGNHLKCLPSELFFECFKLKLADFSGNQLKSLPSELFHDCFDLNSIYFQHNQIEEIPHNFFVTNTYLENVEFGTNQIKEIHQHLFAECIHLTLVCFNHNKLSKIDGDWFENSTEIEFLDLHDNQITEVSELFCRNCRSLRSFNFNNNPYALKIRGAFRWHQQLRECFMRGSREP